jgi:hypothetical protein
MLAAGRYEVPIELAIAVYIGFVLIGVTVALWKARK